MIGTQEEAADLYWSMLMDDAAPEGWTVLGQGSQRIAVLAPSGVVYKVSIGALGLRANRREVAWMREWRDEGATCIPLASLHEVEDQWGGSTPVVAMEHIKADDTEADLTEVLRLTIAAGVLDINGGNWIVRDGRAWIIDAGGVE